MSASQEHNEPDASPRAGEILLGGGSGDENFSRDFADEIADHLQRAQCELEESGKQPEEARHTARLRFGNVARIRSKCWWVQKGDDVMLKTGMIVAAVLVVLAIVLPFASHLTQAQVALTDQIDALSQQLGSLNETQRTMLEQSQQAAQAAPLRIVGTAYLGDASRAAAGAEIQIRRLPNMEVVRQLKVDPWGTFQSEPLPAGDYIALATLAEAHGFDNLMIQTAPILLYPGMEQKPLNLDLKFQHGELAFELSRDLSEPIVVGERKVEFHVEVFARLKSLRLLPWAPGDSRTPKKWPLFGVILRYQKDMSEFAANRKTPPGWIWIESGHPKDKDKYFVAADDLYWKRFIKNSEFVGGKSANILEKPVEGAFMMPAGTYGDYDLAVGIMPVVTAPESDKNKSVLYPPIGSLPKSFAKSREINSYTRGIYNQGSKGVLLNGQLLKQHDGVTFLDGGSGNYFLITRPIPGKLIPFHSQVSIPNQKRVRLKIVVPNDLEKQVRDILTVEKPTDSQWRKAMAGRLARFEVVATEPIKGK